MKFTAIYLKKIFLSWKLVMTRFSIAPRRMEAIEHTRWIQGSNPEAVRGSMSESERRCLLTTEVKFSCPETGDTSMLLLAVGSQAEEDTSISRHVLRGSAVGCPGPCRRLGRPIPAVAIRGGLRSGNVPLYTPEGHTGWSKARATHALEP